MADTVSTIVSTTHHARPTEDETAMAIHGVSQMSSKWRQHADEQDRKIELLQMRIADLERIQEEHATRADEEAPTLAQAVPTLQAKVTFLKGKIAEKDLDIARLHREVQAAKMETHKDCRKSFKDMQQKLAMTRIEVGDHGTLVSMLRKEILELKARLVVDG